MQEYDEYLGQISINDRIRVLVIVPSPPPPEMDEIVKGYRQGVFDDRTQIDMAYCPQGPDFIDDEHDSKKVAPLVVAKAKWAEKQGYHAVVVGCMLDPGVDEAKKIVTIPVIGVKEASLVISKLIGPNSEFIYPEDIQVGELAEQKEVTVERLKEEAKKARNKGNDIVILGCTSLGRLSQQLSEELKMTVMPNEDLAILIAYTLATLKIKRFG